MASMVTSCRITAGSSQAIALDLADNLPLPRHQKLVGMARRERPGELAARIISTLADRDIATGKKSLTKIGPLRSAPTSITPIPHLQAPGQGLQGRQFMDARRAPAGPEVDQQRLCRIISKRRDCPDLSSIAVLGLGRSSDIRVLRG